MRFALLLIAISLRGQTAFPLRPLADSGDVASRREERPNLVRLEGRDGAGQPWRVWLKEPGAVFQTNYFVGDLDRDGQLDLLVQRPLPGLGRCVGRAEILVLRMDARGRPVPLVFESAAVAIRRGRDGTAEFFASNGCADAGYWVGLKALVRATMASGRLEELRSGEFGCRGMQRNNDLFSIKGNRVERQPDACADSPGESMIVSGRWVQGWPSRVVVDDPAGRDVHLQDAELGLRRAFTYGCNVRFDGDELWADGCTERRGVDVELHVRAMRRGASAFFDRKSDSSEYTLDTERNAIHTAHSAFGVTHRHTTEYEAPAPGARLISLECRYGLTQWRSASGTFFALHDDGRLREPRVAVPVSGQLMPGEDGPVFRQADRAFAVAGYLRWRLAP